MIVISKEDTQGKKSKKTVMAPGVVMVLALLALLPVLEASLSGSQSNYRIPQVPSSAAQVKEDNTRPKGTEDYPDGFWFGTQSLLCVMGMTGSPSSGRKRRDVMSPSRYSLRFSHRVLYYRGALYEWGTGTLGYFIGTAPSVVECEIKWEAEPTGNSTCSPDTITEFTYDYRSRYGVYNIATNNCHHFANRISELLSSPSCSARPSDWTRVTRRFWRYLGELIDGVNEDPHKLDDINDHYDRTAIH